MNLSQLTASQLAEHRPVLFRYALMQLRDGNLADDLAQETLLAALQGLANFAANANPRTWLIGILKHKIADHWRRNARETSTLAFDSTAGETSEIDLDEFFLEDGHWQSPLSAWSDPEAAFQQQEFWAVYEFCQNNLPPKQSQVFMLRELVGMEVEEICLETGVSEANYWVIMHRARLRLRECLEIRWFNRSTQAAGGMNA